MNIRAGISVFGVVRYSLGAEGIRSSGENSKIPLLSFPDVQLSPFSLPFYHHSLLHAQYIECQV